VLWLVCVFHVFIAVCVCVCVCVLQAVDEPAYLAVGTDVSAKYRGAFCEAKIKTVKRLVKVKVRPGLTSLLTPLPGDRV